MAEALRGTLAAPLLDQADALAGEFAAARPFRHAVVDAFFEPAFARDLLAAFPSFEQGNSLGEHGRAGGKSTFEHVRALGPTFARLDDLLKSAAFLAWLQQVTGIAGLRYDPWYLGGGTHENRSGATLSPHIDFNFHPVERWQRRLNLIVYLNPEWQEAWGGALALYRDPATDPAPALSVSPGFNRAVLFETHDHSWHGFDPIALPADRQDVSRRSLAFYFYSDPQDVAHKPAHSTVYVTRGMPAHLHAGHVLSNADMDGLAGILAEKDERIAIQYAEISRLMTLARAHERGMTGRLMYLARRAMATLRQRRGA